MLSTSFCLITSSKLSRQQFEFSLNVKVMGSNPDYLPKNFLLYNLTKVLVEDKSDNFLNVQIHGEFAIVERVSCVGHDYKFTSHCF